MSSLRLPLLLAACSLLSDLVAADEEDATIQLPDFVLEVTNSLPPLAGKPGVMVFPPEPIRLIETHVSRSLVLEAPITANRRRPKLRPQHKIVVQLAQAVSRPPLRGRPSPSAATNSSGPTPR